MEEKEKISKEKKKSSVHLSVWGRFWCRITAENKTREPGYSQPDWDPGPDLDTRTQGPGLFSAVC